MNCDRIAAVYRWCEYAAFGSALERQRDAYLAVLKSRRRFLILGDGDGRFLSRLAECNQDGEFDSVDLSARMLVESGKRLARAAILNRSRIRLHQADARNVTFSHNDYDAIVTHFFLDCFSTAEVEYLIERVRNYCGPTAVWVIAEFHQPARGWQAWHARFWLRLMYRFFGLTTGLETGRLPQYEPALLRAGFALQSRQSSRAGLIRSEMWTLG